MHQPYYKDPETGTYILPWVRLHAVKDYVSLPRIFREFPAVRHTFNLVPSLLIQVQDYVESGAEDMFLAVSRKNALDLTRDEERFVLRNFFSANPPTMILPHPRYAELYHHREEAVRAVGRTGVHGGFGASEYTDLATLFNLVWIHPVHRDEDRELSRLWRKEKGFTEREKTYVLDRQIEIMASVIPEYRRLVEHDGGELSSSPMYHPILPLLIDSRAANAALPGAALPSLPFAYPEDAMEQLTRGREVFRSLFGGYPQGLWPSEGSISPATLAMAAETGFRWAATDEILLSKAIGKRVYRDHHGVPHEPGWLYQPYDAPTPSGNLRMLFRDHHLSDLIGFEYSRWNASDAAEHFANILGHIYRNLSSIPLKYRKEAYIVPVILDGENAWEYFPDSANGFLRTFLHRLSRLSPGVSFASVGEALEKFGPAEPLRSTPTGSWIDGTFNIWIGHREDHQAWEMLARVRGLWQRRYDKVRNAGLGMPEELAAAREHLLVAEGSDWCWWYGDEHHTPHGPEFDRLFRNRIKAAYRELGETPPDSADIPIIRPDRIPAVRNHLVSPRGYIRPVINGRLTSYFEWSVATRHFPVPEFGAMHRAGTGVLSCLYYGFDECTLYFRLDLDPATLEPQASPLEIEFLFPAKNRKVRLVLFPSDGSLRACMGAIGENCAENRGAAMPEVLVAAFDKVLEMGIPFQELGCEREERISFFLTIHVQGTAGERHPTYGAFTADLPGRDFEQRMWDV